MKERTLGRVHSPDPEPGLLEPVVLLQVPMPERAVLVPPGTPPAKTIVESGWQKLLINLPAQGNSRNVFRDSLTSLFTLFLFVGERVFFIFCPGGPAR